MEFDLRAVIATDAAAAEVKERCSRAVVVRLVQGLSLIPITPELKTQAGRGQSEPAGNESALAPFQELTPGLLQLLGEASRASPIAYVEGDESDDTGRQVAAAWSGGQLIFGPKSLGPVDAWPAEGGPIDEALRLLGAKVDAMNADEFMCVGLASFRHTQQWIDLALLIDRLPDMELAWVETDGAWGDYEATVSEYPLGLSISHEAGGTQYVVSGIACSGTTYRSNRLKTLERLPLTWRLLPRQPTDYVGRAKIEPDGTIVLYLDAPLPGGGVAHGVKSYRRYDPQYSEIIDHIGDLHPGEIKPVRPWPDKRQPG